MLGKPQSEMGKTIKIRNPVAKELRENTQFRLKVVNPKKSPPKEPTIKEALIEMEEEEDDEL
jgi:hypothetical protein